LVILSKLKTSNKQKIKGEKKGKIKQEIIAFMGVQGARLEIRNYLHLKGVAHIKRR